MKSLRLLAFGGSLASGRDIVGRFRVRSESLLPQFGDTEESSSQSSTEPPAPVPPGWRRWFGWLLLSREPRITLAPTQNPAGQSEADASPQPSGVGGRPGLGTATGWNPFRKQVTEPKPRQAEFRFANVTVVCNDLHDADFEIVSPAKVRRPKTPLAEPNRTEPAVVARA